MSLQDKSVVRSATDLERKYNLAKLVGLAGNIETNSESLIKVENELNNFISSTAESLEEIQKQIDGSITTYYYSGVPTLSNLPTSEWPIEEYTNHVGDLYYDKDTGYAYRFIYDGETNVYSWLELSDSSVSEALALANAAKDTADSKRRVFVSQPTTPYDNGDLWVQGTNGDIMVCQLARATGNYDSGDWIVASKYTDNTYAKAIVDEMGGTTTEVLGGTVTQYTKNWVKFTDLSTGGSTTIAGENITTGNIKSSNYVAGKSGTNINLTDGKITTKNVAIDDEGMKLSNGAKVVGNNGLMNTYLYEGEGIVGYERDYYYNEATGDWDHIATGGIVLNFVIPKGLTITEAKVQLIHSPIYWVRGEVDEAGNQIPLSWGKCKNLKISKATNVYSRLISAPLNAGILYDRENTTYSAIDGALGTSGWTPSVNPSDTSHNAETKESEDIKSSLVEGLNRIKISGPEATQTWSDVNMAANSGYVYAVLKINGYMTYE